MSEIIRRRRGLQWSLPSQFLEIERAIKQLQEQDPLFPTPEQLEQLQKLKPPNSLFNEYAALFRNSREQEIAAEAQAAEEEACKLAEEKAQKLAAEEKLRAAEEERRRQEERKLKAKKARRRREARRRKEARQREEEARRLEEQRKAEETARQAQEAAEAARFAATAATEQIQAGRNPRHRRKFHFEHEKEAFEELERQRMKNSKLKLYPKKQADILLKVLRKYEDKTEDDKLIGDEQIPTLKRRIVDYDNERRRKSEATQPSRP